MSDYFADLQKEISDARDRIKKAYGEAPDKTGTYDTGYADGVLSGLKLARSLYYKHYPERKKNE